MTRPTTEPTTEPTTDPAPSATGTARHHWGDRDVEIAYDTFGAAAGEPLVLIMGIGEQRYAWSPQFCAALVGRGFQVTRFDNRDTGASTRFDDAGRPGQLQMWLRPAGAAAYTLEDMAGDVLAVLDAQQWDSAHLVGVSMGGMIAQVAACGHPDRVRSLTSISSGPAPRLGAPRLRTMLRLAKVMKAPVTDARSLARQKTDLAAIVGSPAYPTDTGRLDDLAQRTFAQRGDLAAAQRHTAAIAAGGDRRRQLAELRVPTLVLHGDADPMVRPVAGRATADAVPGARLRTFPGMGHDLPRELWDEITAVIADIAGLATRRAPASTDHTA
jgi:pimeloyl-ACP methyl ester carboxylesterase